MSRTIKEIQNDIRTLTRVPSLFINQKLNELADEVGAICEQSRLEAIDDFANTLTENYDYLPQILSQEAFGLYIDEYAEWLKSGGENEQSIWENNRENR